MLSTPTCNSATTGPGSNHFGCQSPKRVRITRLVPCGDRTGPWRRWDRPRSTSNRWDRVTLLEGSPVASRGVWQKWAHRAARSRTDWPSDPVTCQSPGSVRVVRTFILRLMPGYVSILARRNDRCRGRRPPTRRRQTAKRVRLSAIFSRQPKYAVLLESQPWLAVLGSLGQQPSDREYES